jgi:hypothetical protein
MFLIRNLIEQGFCGKREREIRERERERYQGGKVIEKD